MAVARLGYEIDSSGAVVAEQNLDDMAAAAKRAEMGAKKVTGTAAKFGGAMKSSAAQTANLGAQLNDIGVMLAAGQNPLQLAVQQGTQINQVFAQMGGGSQALRGLAAGFMSMVNPMSLATIGIIAGGAALVQWAVSAVDSETAADRLSDASDRLGDTMGALEATSQLVLDDMDTLTKRYGDQAAAVRALFRELVAVNKQQALNAAQATIIAAQDQFNELERSLRDFADRRRELLRAQDIDAETIAGVLPSEMRRLQGEVEAAAQAIAEDFNLTTAQAFRIVDALNAVEAAAGPEEAAQAAAALASAIASAAEEGADLSAEMANVASSAAQAFAAVQEVIETGRQAAQAPGLTPDMGMGLLPTQRELGGGGGRRRGGGSRVDEFARDLERLRESLRTEREVVDEWHAEQQEILNNRRAMEILGIEGHNEAKLRLEQEYQERIAGISKDGLDGNLGIMNDFFGDAAGLMQSGNAKLFKIGQAAAIANAVVNGHSAAIAAWDKGMQAGGPPLAAAFTALSVAKTASQIAALKGASFGGGGGSGSSSSAGVTATSAVTQPQQTRAIISLQGGRSRFTVEEINDITRQLQEQSDDGVIIEGFTRG